MTLTLHESATRRRLVGDLEVVLLQQRLAERDWRITELESQKAALQAAIDELQHLVRLLSVEKPCATNS